MGNPDRPEKTLDAKNRVLDSLSDHSTVRAPGALGARLKKIRQGSDYFVDIFKHVLPTTPPDLSELFFEEGLAEYGWCYTSRKREVASVVATQSLPDTAEVHLAKIKECYSLGLFEATVIFCRAVIEASLFEALKRRGMVTMHRNVDDHAEYNFAFVRNTAKPLFKGDGFSRCCGREGVVRLANRILHAKRGPVRITQAMALECIRATYALLEEAFA